ncbi:MAG: hypothetical protein ACRCYY_04545 [Trueperaceae bacterium]
MMPFAHAHAIVQIVATIHPKFALEDMMRVHTTQVTKSAFMFLPFKNLGFEVFPT